MTSYPRIRRQFKVCLIGDGYVGKSSIRRTYLREGFKKSYIPTLGVDFAQKSMEYNGVPTNLVIWDIAGQPAYAGLRKRYYEGASGLILVYSVVDRASFDNASKWLVEAHGFVQNLPPMIIAANKIDLSPSHPEEELVTPEEGREFAEIFSKKLNTPVYFIETSALKGINIDEVFFELVRMMVDGIESKRITPKEEAPIQPPESAPTQVVATATTNETHEEPVSETAPAHAAMTQEEVAPEETTASTSEAYEEPASDTEPAYTSDTYEEATSEEITASASEAYEEPASDIEPAYTSDTYEEATSEEITASASEAYEEPASDIEPAYTSDTYEEATSEEATASTSETYEEPVSVTGEAYTSESYEEATSEEITASASEAYEEPVSETSFFKTPVSSEPSTSESESVSIPKEIEIDPVTALAKDSEYLYEEQIGKEMVKLVELRAKLQTAEEELANVILQLETSLLNLRNVVHVKKIMFEHLKKELETTRKEWAEAYNEYLNTDQRRKTELEERTRQIEEIRKHIEEIGKTVRGRVSDLEMKRLSE